MTNYEAWSLEDLKSAAADLDVTALSTHSSTFYDGGQALQSIGDSFSDALNYLAGGWKGDAAQAAASSAQSSISTVTDTQSLANQGHDATEVYAFDTRSQQREVAAIPDVDTGWGHAASSGWLGGLGGIAIAKYQQHQEYEKQRAKAAKLVGQIDSRGKEQADTMHGQEWPAFSGDRTPPVALQPPADRAATAPQATGTGPATSYGHEPGYAGQHVAANYATSSVSPTPQHHGATVTAISGPHGGGSVTPTSAAPTPTGAVPVPSGGPVEAAAASGGPGLAGSLGLAGGAAAVAGGAAVLGGGPLSGQLRTAGGIGSRGLAGSERAGEFGRGSGRGGEFGRSGSSAEGRVGRAPLEGRAGAALPGEAERAGMVGRGAAAEAVGRGSGTGAYPPGGSSRGRNDEDDELRARPDWLMEQDDIWGDGRLAAPPVLG